MSDDIWRKKEPDGGSGRRQPGRYESEMDEFDPDEFGGPLFGDESGGMSASTESDRKGAAATGDDASGLSLTSTSGSMPHWTEPPTGEAPTIKPSVTEPPANEHRDDGLDVWSSFTTDSPVWGEGDSVDEPSGAVTHRKRELPADPIGDLSWEDDPSGDTLQPTGDNPTVLLTGDPSVDDPAGAGPAAATEAVQTTGVNGENASQEPARITIGTDPAGMPRSPEHVRRGGPPQRPPSAHRRAGSDDRNLPVAVGVGVALAAVFLLMVRWRPVAALLFVVVALGVAGLEYFGRVREKGYRPAVATGLAAIICAPLTAYWVGVDGLPLVIVLAFMAGAGTFIGARSIESGPMPNMAITSLGVIWIGIMGSYAALMLDWSNFGDGTPWGTDTLVITAIGVVANDVGAYFTGLAFGRTPLRSWISPAKSVEGFLGGTILTLVVMVILGLRETFDTWNSTNHLLMLGIVISITAPLGDLTESMFKRNLDVKDFGTLIKGHGGILDRFDGFFITVPAVYYLFLIVKPWTAFTP